MSARIWSTKRRGCRSGRAGGDHPQAGGRALAANQSYLQRESRQRLVLPIALDRRLRETFRTREGMAAWLRAPNRYLGGLTPAEAARVGRFDRVEAALEALDSGVFT